MMPTMTIVAENRVGLGMGLIAEHGFCAWVEAGDYRLLWDTGQGFCLPQNAGRLGIDLTKVNAIALSHGHFDHTGGLAHALRTAGGAEVVCHPACFEKKKVRRELAGKTIEVSVGLPNSREELTALGARFRLVTDSVELAPGVYFFTGIPLVNDFETIEPGFFIETPEGPKPDDFRDDACLAVRSERGVSVILGCAHRGLVNTLRHISSRLAVTGIYSVWGGTHLIERAPEQLDKTITALRELGLERIGAAHCTGFHNEIKLAQAFPEQFAVAATGARLEL